MRCSSRLESSAPGVFAAGDICEYDSVDPRRCADADRALGRRLQPRQDRRAEHARQGRTPRGRPLLLLRARATGANSSTSGRRYEWDEEILRGSFEDGSFTNWYLKDGVVKAALTFGRSDDLDAARRLIVDGSALDERQRAALGDLDADLAVGRVLGPRAGAPVRTRGERPSVHPRSPAPAARARPVRLVDGHAAGAGRLRLRGRGRAIQLERGARGHRLLADGLGERDHQRARPALRRPRRAVDGHRPQQLRDPDRPHDRDIAVLRDQRGRSS